MALPKEALDTARQPELSSGSFSPRQKNPEAELYQSEFLRRVAHLYDNDSGVARRGIPLVDNKGRVRGGTGGNARTATSEEIRYFLENGEHHPLDEQELLSVRQLERQERGFSVPERRVITDFRSGKRETASRRRMLNHHRERGGRSPQNQGGRR